MITLILSAVAHADEQDPLNVVAGFNLQRDDNVFRLSDNANVALATGRSERWDVIKTGYAGIRLDKQYSLQRFKFDYTLTSYNYQNYKFLDFDAKEYKAAWLWSLTPYLTGTLSADRSQSQYGFQDYNNYRVSNIRTTENEHFDLDFSPHGNWHAMAGYTNNSVSTTQAFGADPGFSQDVYDLGVKYVFSSGTTMQLIERRREGRYENRVVSLAQLFDNRYSEDETEARLDWPLTGKSKINLKLSHVSREHQDVPRRDYSGFAGKAIYTWTPTGKVQVAVSASRELASFQTIYSNYTQLDTFSVAPLYAVTPKITARANASVSERSFLGQALISGVNRVDTMKAVGVSVDWAPINAATISASAQHSNRSSNLTGLDFKDNTFSVSASLFF